MRIVERFAKLSGALAFANSTDAARTAQAGMGRQPKKKTSLDDIRPIYDMDKHDNLIPRAELLALAASLGVSHLVATNPETSRETS